MEYSEFTLSFNVNLLRPASENPLPGQRQLEEWLVEDILDSRWQRSLSLTSTELGPKEGSTITVRARSPGLRMFIRRAAPYKDLDLAKTRPKPNPPAKNPTRPVGGF
ncbi:hypothetical protein N7510_005219 [Penicillium lagena]|uniref:uncharacterized protein n=1 Tax=Penicillium lagena TaxID=94218 RepID=UPI002541A750|nr:uncharacterized protein N7510_005219 [Penicillium lagena]KAJ5612025.1 hypothetical protein N7510_005219 [Penicillium lagena]